jgi:hypothetical protein
MDQMASAKRARCPACGSIFLKDEALMSWLSGKSPNPLSCPVCGEFMPSLGWKNFGGDDGASEEGLS